MAFSENVLETINATKEPLIETADDDRAYTTIIWAVVADDDVYVRSVRGSGGKWYQRAVAKPDVRLHVGTMVIDAVATRTSDTASIESCSRALREKYRPGPSLDAMLSPDTLETTLRLDPR